MISRRSSSRCAPRHGVLVLLALGASTGLGCRSVIESGLTEEQANEVIVALDENGIHGTKESAAGGDTSGYEVEVATDDVAAALAVLRAEELPHRDDPGLHEVFGEGSLVPTAVEERARLSAALGGELARSIEAIDGVLDARVHVALPEGGELLLDAPQPRPRASVMIRHRGATAPYDESAIRRLIAGAIQGMGVEDVVIVAVPASEAPSGGEHLTSIGPISVARGSSGLLRIVLGVLLGTNVLLALALVAAIVRRRAASTGAPAPGATTTTTSATKA